MDVTTEIDRKNTIKCVVWDLDHTIWDGVLLEDDQVSLREDAVSIIQALDNRGILQSIASNNDYTIAMQQLRDFNLDEFFLFPKIGWNSKVSSIEEITQCINIGLEAVAFIDDDPFERGAVQFSLPEVLCIDAANLDQVLDMPEMNPGFITVDSKMRRKMYLNDLVRNKVEGDFVGPKEAFLASLNMTLTIFPAKEEDLRRAEELTLRTNQLNATGYTYSYNELNYFRQSDGYKLLMARLEDKYGTYGHIGLALVKCNADVWTIKLLLMSCRVMSRGVGSIMLNHLIQLAKHRNVCLQAEFVPNDRNRMMDITYRFAGFYELDEIEGLIVFEHNLSNPQPFPDYVK